MSAKLTVELTVRQLSLISDVLDTELHEIAKSRELNPGSEEDFDEWREETIETKAIIDGLIQGR